MKRSCDAYSPRSGAPTYSQILSQSIGYMLKTIVSCCSHLSRTFGNFPIFYEVFAPDLSEISWMQPEHDQIQTSQKGRAKSVRNNDVVLDSLRSVSKTTSSFS